MTEDDAHSHCQWHALWAGGRVWTESLPRALRMTRALQAGQIWVNTYRAMAVQVPFGGFKESGFGREKGEQALDEFLASKNVMIDFSNDRRDPFAVRT